MVILVTGASGFLGRVHVNTLLESGEFDRNDIRALVRKTSKIDHLKDLGVPLVYGDFLHPESLKGIMKDVSDVYHNASIVINESVSPKIMMKVNFGGTKALVEEFLKSKTSNKFVYASTSGVSGFKCPKYPINEDYPPAPANAYQKSKLASEEFLWTSCQEQGLDATAIRNPNILGPRDLVTSIRVCKGLLEGKIPLVGNGENAFSMVDARDSSRAMLLAAKSSESRCKVYNVKSFDISQRDYFNLYADACGAPRPTRRFPYWLAYAFAWFKEKTTPKGKESLITRTRLYRYSRFRLLDTTRIKKELGFKPMHSDPATVIKESVDWLVANGYLKIDQKSRPL